MQIISVKRAHPKEERLGYLTALMVKSELDWNIATINNIPNDGEVFVHTGYRDGIEKKFRDNELISIDVTELQFSTGSCKYGADGKKASPLRPDDDICTIFETNQIITNENIVKLSTIIKPTYYSFLYLYENDHKKLFGPFELTSSQFIENEEKWDCVFGLAKEGKRFFQSLEPFSVYTIDIDSIPSGLISEVYLRNSNESIYLASGLIGHIRHTPFSQKPLISNSQLINLIDDYVTPSNRLGRKGKKDLLKEIQSSTKLNSLLKQKVENLLISNLSEDEELRKKIHDAAIELHPDFKNKSITNSAIALPVDNNEKEKEKEKLGITIKNLEMELSTTLKIKEELEKKELLAKKHLQEQNDNFQNVLREFETNKSIQTDIQNLKNEKNNLEVKVKELKETSSGLEDTVSLLKSDLQLNTNQFRTKALQVLPFLEIMNNIKPIDEKNHFKKGPANEYFEANNGSELVDELSERIKRCGYLADDSFVRLVTILVLTNKFVGFFGPPGTGKTTLAKIISKSLTPIEYNREIVRVAKGWSSHSDFVGYDNAFSGMFKYKNNFFKNFEEDTEIFKNDLFTLVFDEATLSSPELYLSDFISNSDNYSDTKFESINFSGHTLLIPNNLKFLLTFNVDETTEYLSDRMIDRMPVVFIDQLQLDDYLEQEIEELDEIAENFDHLNFLPLNQNSVFSILKDTDLKSPKLFELESEFQNRFEYWKESLDISISHRKKQQIQSFLKLASTCEKLEINTIVDFVEDTFLLPKLKGSGSDFSDSINKLLPHIKSKKTNRRIRKIQNIGSSLQLYRHL